MKKSILIIAAFVALAMLASCQKEQFTENVAPVTGVTEFTATIEQPTKTVIAANGKVTWKAGDEITVTDAASNSAVYVAGADGASTTFTLKTGETAVGEGPYTATYGDIANQIYSAEGANYPLAAPATSTTVFRFSSLYAVVKITAKSDGEEVIDSVGVSYGEKIYTLNCGEGVTLTSDGIDFFVAVETATEAAALSVTFHTTDDKTATKTRKEAVTLAAKDLLPVTLTFAEGDWESTEEIEITTGTIGEHDYVEINGVKWATQNLAITESGNMKWKGVNTGDNPEVNVPGTDSAVIVGDYFQWAAHVGYCGSQDGSDKGLLIYNSFTNDRCVWENSDNKFSLKAVNSNDKPPFYYFSDQTFSSETYRYISPYYVKGSGYSKKTDLVLTDDVANILWGDNWRMPTNEEFRSLYNVTYWAWDATDMGYYVFLPADASQSKGGASGEIGSLEKSKALLFFPCSGSGSTFQLTGNGYYWSSTVCGESDAYVMILTENSVQFSNIRRYYGCSVRPVSN